MDLLTKYVIDNQKISYNDYESIRRGYFDLRLSTLYLKLTVDSNSFVLDPSELIKIIELDFNFEININFNRKQRVIGLFIDKYNKINSVFIDIINKFIIIIDPDSSETININSILFVSNWNTFIEMITKSESYKFTSKTLSKKINNTQGIPNTIQCIIYLQNLLSEYNNIDNYNKDIFIEHFLNLLENLSIKLNNYCNYCLEKIDEKYYLNCSNCNLKLHYLCCIKIFNEYNDYFNCTICKSKYANQNDNTNYED